MPDDEKFDLLSDKVKLEHCIKRISELEKKYELNKKGIPETIYKYYNKNKEVLRDVVSLTVPNHLKKQLLAKLDVGSARQTDDAKQVEKLLNNMGCDVGVASVKWGPNLIKETEKKEMTEEEMADWILEQSCDIKTEKKECCGLALFNNGEYLVCLHCDKKYPLKEDSGGEKEMVKKGLGDDSFVDTPEPNRLSSNERVYDIKEGIPSIHSKPPEPKIAKFKDVVKGMMAEIEASEKKDYCLAFNHSRTNETGNCVSDGKLPKEYGKISEFAMKVGYIIIECEGHSATYYHNKLIELKKKYEAMLK